MSTGAKQRDPGTAAFPIVALGASASGLEALQAFFHGLPANPGAAFVVVSHLDPTHTSSLPEILARATRLTVVPAVDGPLEADHVYVLQPNAGLAVRDGMLRTTARPAGRTVWRPIDEFLITLAEDQHERVVAIILSGAGADGSQGIAAVKLHGGVVLAQDPETAGATGMPRSAIRTGHVDRVLPPEQLAAALTDYYPAKARRSRRSAGIVHEAVGRIVGLLQERLEHDFRCYKPAMLGRRIARRMRLRNLDDAEDYLSCLRDHPEEVAALGEDFLIGVTSFFRDPRAWDALRRLVVTPLIRDATVRSAIRVWVPACGTGEEAYSLAMLFQEEAQAQGKQINLSVFATDLSAPALAKARSGTYPASIDLQVSPERLARFFTRADDTYRVTKSLRERIVFAQHDLLQNPSFSRMNLISCRNLLIYLEPEAQQRLLRLFNFALQQGGYLFLGRSESAGKAEDLFQPVSQRWRIWRRTAGANARNGVFASSGASLSRGAARNAPRDGLSLEERVRASLSSRYAPASVVIDGRFQVLYFHGATAEFLNQPAGTPTRDLRRMLRDGLSLELIGAVRRASEERGAVTVSGGRLRGADEVETPVSITVCPLTSTDSEEALLVSFEKHAPRRREVGTPASDADLEQLQAELAATREEQRSLVEILETANEELSAANEEIQATSEEFQATNEELETSQEELQAVNEELASLNQELREKVEALDRTSTDLENILTSIGMATLFVDRELAIRWFGPIAARILFLVPGDVGRPLIHLAHPLFRGDMLAQAAEAMRSGALIESEIQDDAGLWYLRRTGPYRAADGQVEGVVAAYLDITGRKEVEARLAAAREFAEAVDETIPTPLLVLDSGLRVKSLNPAFSRTFNVTEADCVGRIIYELSDGAWNIPGLRDLLEKTLPQDGALVNVELRHPWGEGQRILLLQGRRIERLDMLLLTIEDITARKQAEEERVRLLEAEQRSMAMAIREAHHRIKNNLQAVSDLLSLELGPGASAEAAPALQASLQRVQSIAVVHDLLSHDHPENVNVQEVVERLLPLSLQANGLEPAQLDLQVEVAAVQLRSREASLLAVLLNELLSNCAKHAFAGRPGGSLQLRVSASDSTLSLVVQDDGPGLPPGFDRATNGRVGLLVVEALAEGSLGGSFKLSSDHGCRADITIPLSGAPVR